MNESLKQSINYIYNVYVIINYNEINNKSLG